VWIRLYLLPQDYWDNETLKDIGNTLGNFVKIADQTKTNKYTSYVRICIYMHIAKSLSDSICLSHEDTEWIQTLNYEHVPFRCHKCHKHGHLFRDFPQNKKTTAPKDATFSDEEGFHTIPTRRRNTRKPHTAAKSKDSSTSNIFQVLAQQIP
jgi:hypothetical protein